MPTLHLSSPYPIIALLPPGSEMYGKARPNFFTSWYLPPTSLRNPWVFDFGRSLFSFAPRFEREKTLLLQKRFPRGTRHVIRERVAIATFSSNAKIDGLRCRAIL